MGKEKGSASPGGNFLSPEPQCLLTADNARAKSPRLREGPSFLSSLHFFQAITVTPALDQSRTSACIHVLLGITVLWAQPRPCTTAAQWAPMVLEKV